MGRKVRIKTIEDYLTLIRQLEEILKERGVTGDKEKEDEVRRELLNSEELKLNGVPIRSDSVNDVFQYRNVKNLRDNGKSWLEILNSEAYSDDRTSNSSIIDLLEYETGKTIRSGKDILDLIGDGELWGRDTKDKDTLKDLQEVHLVTQEERLARKIKEMIDDGKTWKDLISIDLKEYGLEEWRSEGPLSHKNYRDFLINQIGFYFHLLDYRITPFKPSDIVKIIEAPRAVEFELKRNFEEGEFFWTDSYIESVRYLLKEDAQVRLVKRQKGEKLRIEEYNDELKEAAVKIFNEYSETHPKEEDNEE